MLKLNAQQLRSGQMLDVRHQISDKNEIYIVLDNVLDTYNVGAIFRLADAVAAKKIYLCGGTETPPNSRIKKASINTTDWVEWEYASDPVEVIKNLKFKIKNLSVVAIEQNKKAVIYNKYEYKMPTCLVVGNESYGILPATLKVCDRIVEIPMFGVNLSLNVMVSLAIVLYQIIDQNNLDTK